MRPLLVALLLFVSSAGPVLANDEQDCFQGKVAQVRIKGCSEIIQRAPNDATAYHNRAVGYELSGDTDRAIADYTKTTPRTRTVAARMRVRAITRMPLLIR